MSKQTDKIFFKEHKRSNGSILAEVTLNSPKSFNALDLNMILALKKQLEVWKKNSNVSLVFINGEGEKAFCAGGDVKKIYYDIMDCKKKNQDPGLLAQSFFENEYRTNYLMHTYPKPIVLWGHGVVMGGGLGLFCGSSHPIVTETSLFSMPEISIGLFPDVGGSYFLNQIKGRFGLYLALTACRFNATEALYLNLSQISFKNSDKKKVFNFLLYLSFENLEDFDKKIKNFQKETNNDFNQENWLKENESNINQLLESNDIQMIYEKFDQSSIQDKKWLKNKETFLRGSPSSAGVICEQLKRGQNMNLKDVFKMELTMAMQHSRHWDFLEGVRALLVEKTNDPKWKPDHIKKIKDSWVSEHFKNLPDWTNSLNNL